MIAKQKELRDMIPILQEEVYGKNLVYLDNAATCQKPQSVIDQVIKLSKTANANIHRSVYCLANKATSAFENTRYIVKEFLNAECEQEIIFTSGTTAAINLVAFSFGEKFVQEGDEIIISQAEHHSNLVPWYLLAQHKNAKLRVLPIDENGELMLEKLEELLNERTKILAITHISNVLGIVNPIKKVIDICHTHNVPVLIDGAQGIVHQNIDVQALDCDFYCFSGHKIGATSGTGVLYGKKKWLEQMPPFLGGGEMIAEVDFDKITFADLPFKFEAGTQNFTNIPTLKEGIDFLKLLKDKDLDAELHRISNYLQSELSQIEGLKIIGTPHNMENKVPIFSLAIEGVHSEDLALILDKNGIAVRTGKLCAEPLLRHFGLNSLLRLSLMPYNTMEEAEFFVKSLNKALIMLR